MNAIILILSFFLITSCSSTKGQDVKQYTLSEVTKIDFLDDGEPIIYIKTDSLQGIIIEDDRTLETKKATKIELGKRYPISLTRIEHNYRGRTDEYIITSSKGTQKVIWRYDDGLPLVLYRASNLNGLWLIKNWCEEDKIDC